MYSEHHSWIGTYILDEQGQPRRCSTLAWGQWLELHPERQRVLETRVWASRDEEGKGTIVVHLVSGPPPEPPPWSPYVTPAWVSTVFIGLDHGLMLLRPGTTEREQYRPLLWETMIFWRDWQDDAGREYDHDQWRFHSREEAEYGHWRAVAEVVLSLTVGFDRYNEQDVLLLGKAENLDGVREIAEIVSYTGPAPVGTPGDGPKEAVDDPGA